MKQMKQHLIVSFCKSYTIGLNQFDRTVQKNELAYYHCFTRNERMEEYFIVSFLHKAIPSDSMSTNAMLIKMSQLFIAASFNLEEVNERTFHCFFHIPASGVTASVTTSAIRLGPPDRFRRSPWRSAELVSGTMFMRIS